MLNCHSRYKLVSFEIAILPTVQIRFEMTKQSFFGCINMYWSCCSTAATIPHAELPLSGSRCFHSLSTFKAYKPGDITSVSLYLCFDLHRADGPRVWFAPQELMFRLFPTIYAQSQIRPLLAYHTHCPPRLCL